MTNAEHDPVVIAAAARTAIASFQGAFATQGAPQLGSAAIAAALARSGLA
ncbi:acetyl-CoA C-acetyltransferase, partial [Burkholderia sp. Ap-962]|nr:acetyl-CoA C-acetyltransferase [Burkholderia sp. Ap-962]